MSKKPRVLVGLPHHADTMHMKSARALFAQGSLGDCTYQVVTAQGSLLARTCNVLWSQALSAADCGEITHFAMLHSDVAPEAGWLDILLHAMDDSGASVLSAVIPLKDGRGLTSTAIGDPCDPWAPVRRLSMAEAHRLPATFDADVAGYPGQVLLCNTGCMLVDLRDDWCRGVDPQCQATVYFTIRDRIIRHAGKTVVQVQSEDWIFSRMAADQGATICATTAVSVEHLGSMIFPNNTVWGTCETDSEQQELIASKG